MSNGLTQLRERRGFPVGRRGLLVLPANAGIVPLPANEQLPPGPGIEHVNRRYAGALGGRQNQVEDVNLLIGRAEPLLFFRVMAP